MLTKNVYILYPPGYSGSYLRWALTVSDQDLFPNTIKDPVNRDTTGKFGGVGSAHQHIRIPTHQILDEHIHWVLYNRPTDKLIYLLNCDDYTMLETIASVIRYDPDPAFVVLHNGNDYDTAAYAAINLSFKYAMWLEWRVRRVGILWPDIDIKSIATNIRFRNQTALNFSMFRQLWKADIDTIQNHVSNSRFRQWYEFRNERTPQEVNEDNYLIRELTDNDVYFLNCRDIASLKLPVIVDEINKKFAYSDNFDAGYIVNFQPSYIPTQTALQWFESIANWRRTKQLDAFLLSHSVLQGLVVKEILESNVLSDDVTNADSGTFATRPTEELNDLYRIALGVE
jgi:hypothetical protein